MLDFFIDNIFVRCGGRVFQQTIDILMGTNCALLLADLFLHWYEAEFIADQKRGKPFSYISDSAIIDNVLSFNNPSFRNLIHRIYPKEPEIKDTIDTVKSVSYFDLHLDIDGKGKLLTKLYDKRDDFSFRIINFPSAPYEVFISQLIRYTRACRNYTDFCIALGFLRLGFWDRIMLRQDWSHHFRSLWSSWTRGSLRCIHLHNKKWVVQRVIVFLSFFVYPGLYFLWATRRAILEKLRTLTLPLYLVYAPSF